MSEQNVSLVLRAAVPADAPALADIYNHYVLTSPATFDIAAKSVADRENWLTQFSNTGPHQLLVAEQASEVVGYAYSGRFKERAAYVSSVETSIYLSATAEIQGQGVGSQLYAALFSAIADSGIHRAYAGITQPNAASNALHEKFGFEPIGVYREVGQKFDRYWDVAWFEKKLD